MNSLLKIINKRINFSLPIWLIVILILSFYLIWEIYWYNQVGLRVIKWHTHIMFYVYLWFVIATVSYFIFGRFFKKTFQHFLLLFSAIIFSLTLVEIFLIISQYKHTYLEKIGSSYSSPYTPEHESHYHTWSTNSIEHWIEKPEYKYWRPTNSFGLGDQEWEIQKEKNEIRILSLGDSFTEGDGAPFDSSYPAILRELLSRDSTQKKSVLNAGMLGSDPFFDFKILKDKLGVFAPDIIIQTLSAQDLLTDIIIRGGNERFSEKILKYKSPPKWEFLYAVNYLSRYYFQSLGYTELLRQKHPSKAEKQQLIIQITELFEEYYQYCAQQEIELIIVLRPDRDELLNQKYNFNFTEIIHFLENKKQLKVIDLLSKYTIYIDQSNTHADDYFWVNDGHHNSKGYEMMAKCIFTELKESL